MNRRQFAFEVVQKLQRANYQALWVGGCVRDQLLGLDPKDYDVATDATPDEIRQLFGKRRTLPIGAAFGVITVLGPRGISPIEVATFRRDATYSDGRHPDAVEFTDAREDALRRDFTINGIFFDPVTEQVIDYVGGQADLKSKQIRAIGDPHQRIDEDKLRMLRGVRFAATFGFELESETLASIQEHAAEIKIVSEERIGAELVRMLSHPNCAVAAELLVKSKLWREVLPPQWPARAWTAERWRPRIEELKRLPNSEFPAATAVLLREAFEPTQLRVRVRQLQAAWRITNQQAVSIGWIVSHWKTLVDAQHTPWSTIQPLLVHADARQAIDVAIAISGDGDGCRFCRERLQWPSERLDPAPLLSRPRPD